MAEPIGSRLRKAWNVFRNKEEEVASYWTTDIGPAYYARPDRSRLSFRNERTIINSILNRIALDASSIDIKHVKLDEDGRYLEDIDSGLNRCFNIEANVDQTGRAFRNDMFLTLLDKGSIVLVPTEATPNPIFNEAFDVNSVRVGQVVQWHPKQRRPIFCNAGSVDRRMYDSPDR